MRTACLALTLMAALSQTARAEMVQMKWPAATLSAKRAERDAAIKRDPNEPGSPMAAAKAQRRAIDAVGAAYHFRVHPPNGDTVTVPDFEAKALLAQGFMPVEPAPALATLDVRAALEKAPYSELVQFLTARGVGRHLFAARAVPIDVMRAMALREYDMTPE